MIPQMAMLTRGARTDLWRAADEILDKRGNFAEFVGDQRYDLLHVSQAIQDAAFAAEKHDNAGVIDALRAAANATNDPDARNDVYRLIVALGYDCPAHGAATFTDTTGRISLDGNEIIDTLRDVTICAICGEPVVETRLPVDVVADF